MPDLRDEIRDLAQQLAAIEDEDVIDSAAVIARKYRQRIQMIHALDGVERLAFEDIVAVENRLQERLLNARTDVRDSLKELLVWSTKQSPA